MRSLFFFACSCVMRPKRHKTASYNNLPKTNFIAILQISSILQEKKTIDVKIFIVMSLLPWKILNFVKTLKLWHCRWWPYWSFVWLQYGDYNEEKLRWRSEQLWFVVSVLDTQKYNSNINSIELAGWIGTPSHTKNKCARGEKPTLRSPFTGGRRVAYVNSMKSPF